MNVVKATQIVSKVAKIRNEILENKKNLRIIDTLSRL